MPTQKKSGGAVTATTKVKDQNGTVTNDEENLGDVEGTGPMAEVGFSAGMTLSTGPYESARVDVSIKVPCPVEEIDQVYSFANDWVDTRLGEIVAQIREGVEDE